MGVALPKAVPYALKPRLHSQITVLSPARVAAFEVLKKVAAGGYASDLLLRDTAGLDPRDAGLASEIVFGCLRYQAQLDFLIGHFAARPLKLDPEVRIALRMAIYQVRYLERVPKHAAVGESVELVKRAHKRSAAGLVNAVLRKVNRGAVNWPDRATELSCPAWMLDRWAAHWDRATAEGIGCAALSEPETWVRAPEPTPNLDATDLPGCYRLREGDPPPGSRIQDIGSQSVVPLLGLQAGHRFLDLCAAPGNKTAQALETPVDAIACDVHWNRLRMLDGIDAGRVVLDASAPLPFREPFDRILVDAPCTGTGTLGRNPEIKWRLQPSDLGRLHQLQVRILENALGQISRSGRVVYSTCSLEPEENEDVVREALKSYPDYIEMETRYRIPGREPGDGFFAAAIERVTERRP
jgi:16S rRNA (cytosine967-C5)-methyltransferase